MEFFLDTADVKLIKELNKTGLINGITTNPSLVAKSGKNFLEILKEITKIKIKLNISVGVFLKNCIFIFSSL